MSSSPVEFEFGARISRGRPASLANDASTVELGDGASRAAKARRLGADDGANLDKKLALDFRGCVRRRLGFCARIPSAPEK